MPYVITGEGRGSYSPGDMKSKYVSLYKGRYPNGHDLSPGSPMHDYIVAQVMHRARHSKTIMSNRYSAWKELDHVMTAYVKLDEKEKEVRQQDDRKPTSLVIPIAYALREVILTYETSAFLDELPYFRYNWTGPEDAVGTILLEMVIAQQCRKFKVGLDIYTQLQDGWTYGVGPQVIEWNKKYHKKRAFEDFGYNSVLYNRYVSLGRQETVGSALRYEGNLFTPIDPYMYLPDTRVPAHKVQTGEFVGWVKSSSRTALLSDEQRDEDLFNVRYVDQQGGRSTLASNESGRSTRTGIENVHAIWYPGGPGGGTDIVWMYIDLVPSEWVVGDSKLGDGDYPEKWLFGIAGDNILIKARPLDLDHDMYPVTSAVPTFDGHSAVTVSGIEMITELQRTIDWQISSHITNVRKVLNDMFVIDPLLVNIHDFMHPGPGKLIRVRQSRFGQGVQNAVEQLKVTDVTGQHMQDAELLMNIAQRILGVNENMQGAINPKRERISADETKGARSFGMSRQAAKARIISEQCMWDAAYICARQAQQFMSEETYVESVGRNAQRLAEEYNIQPQGGRYAAKPSDLIVDFDVAVGDRAMPDMEDKEQWAKIFEISVSNPMTVKQLGLDVQRLSIHALRQLGARNVEDFKLRTPQAQVLPNEQVMREAEKGNIAPIQEVMGG